MKIYCVRHGEAHQVTDDPAQSLTDKGKADIEKTAKMLAQHDPHIQHIMHSGINRAKQTAEILAKSLLSEKVTECENLLDAENIIQPMVDMIQTWSEDTMLVGHLPFMSKLVSALVIGNENFHPIVNYPPGTVVCLEYFQEGRWIINWVLRPSIIPNS